MTKVSEVLKLAKSLVDTREKLSHDVVTSCDEYGNVVEYWNPKAVRHCIGHAISLAIRKSNYQGPLDNQLPHFYYFRFGFGQDYTIAIKSKRPPSGKASLEDHDSVMQGFDYAIEAAKEDET